MLGSEVSGQLKLLQFAFISFFLPKGLYNIPFSEKNREQKSASPLLQKQDNSTSLFPSLRKAIERIIFSQSSLISTTSLNHAYTLVLLLDGLAGFHLEIHSLFMAPQTPRGSWLLEQHPAHSQPPMLSPSPLSQGQHENVLIWAINHTADVNFQSPTEITGAIRTGTSQGHGTALHLLPEGCAASACPPHLLCSTGACSGVRQ